ncbi:hypothetical protein [Phenylobacterium sp. J367]|uniref:hypothetical protein n=1 Tax=Phenylobacterium sp. J367 TaxID=2898435 RepID=UPI0021510FB9|nr:hypothetical protein [Phenylobacterium sp. J367]MCR5879136.1 hypothetical protein [Phenylobacterium sp. J367]
MSLLDARPRDCTFRAILRSGVWSVTRDHVFYGDFLTRAEALRQACAAAIAVEALGGTARVLAPPGETLVPHRGVKPPS